MEPELNKIMHSDKSKIFQLYVEAYNEATIQKLIKIFQGQLHGLSEDNIRFYVNRFDQIKNSPKLRTLAAKYPKIKNPLDIFQYTWHQLEVVVDQFPVKSKDQVKMKANNADLIYQKGQLEIYKADTKEKCIYYGQQHFGRQYSFCISRPRDGNLYDQYRLDGRTFYFVKMFDAGSVLAQGSPIEDTHHLYVIHATPDPHEFYVTNSDNDGDIRMDWDDIEEQIPELTGLRELFKFIPFNDDENKQIKTRDWTPQVFVQNLDSNCREEYIQSDYLFLFFDQWSSILDEDQKVAYIKARKDLSNMFWEHASTRTRMMKAYLTFTGLMNEALEYAELAYNLTKEVAKVDHENWIYTDNALLNIYGVINSGVQRVGGGQVAPIYGVDMISMDPDLCEKRLSYDTNTGIIEDSDSGFEWKIINGEVVEYRDYRSEQK